MSGNVVASEENVLDLGRTTRAEIGKVAQRKPVYLSLAPAIETLTVNSDVGPVDSFKIFRRDEEYRREPELMRSNTN
jgi:hypothetical protein